VVWIYGWDTDLNIKMALADAILILHFIFVSFVIGGLLAIWVGAFFRWSWIRNFWFRVVHLAAIAFVAGEAIFGMICPLTEWESDLREAGGRYQGSFMQHWIHKILFYQAPEFVFTTIYVAFTLIVIATMVFIRPRNPFKLS